MALLMRLALVSILVACAWSCVRSVPKKTPGDRLARSKCGACHLRPERHTRSHAEWVQILDEHRERFPLSDEERAQLADHFAKPAPSEQQPPRSPALAGSRSTAGGRPR
ncbi:MAG: hypothetical protein JRI23_25400 [Deltaproteobacteria bacterium]|jgi:hypothetical protein|nr:hypothetical protein [Deltaproteobacteria bacterium]MBW2535355.1 hypothetical protein [Deltaproteobacteria bacterium]